MPLYDYKCRTCKKEEERNVSYERRDIQTCNICGGVLTRRLSMPRIKVGPTPDQVTAEVLEIPEKELPPGLRTEIKR